MGTFEAIEPVSLAWKARALPLHFYVANKSMFTGVLAFSTKVCQNAHGIWANRSRENPNTAGNFKRYLLEIF